MGGFANNAPIVTDGLVFYVDAANSKSYDGSTGGTTWSDLVGANDGALTNMETNPANAGYVYDSANAGSVEFDGANDYASIGYTQPAQSSTTSFTWSIWIYLPTGGHGNNDVIFGNRYGSQNLQFIKITPTGWEYYSGGNQGISYSVPKDQWVNLCVVKNQGTHYYYSNGSQVGTRTATNSIVANPVFMGADGYGSVQESANVKFATAMIYEKALSSTEITQNYNALKNRFV